MSDTSFEKLPPCNIDAERCAIASLMLASDRLAPREDIITEIISTIDRSSFFQADHQIIFEVVADQIKKQKQMDAVIVANILESRKLLDEVGGRDYLGVILNSIPTVEHGGYYAKIVREKAQLRALITACNEGIREAHLPNNETAADDLLIKYSNKLVARSQAGLGDTSQSIGDVMANVFWEIESGGTTLLKTGFTSLDKTIGGIAAGEMIVVAARPSMGKSTLVRQMAYEMALIGTRCGIISVEESNRKMGRNLLSMRSHIDNHRIRSGNVNNEEMTRIMSGVQDLSKLPIWMTDKARKIEEIKITASNWKARHGVQVIFIDYMQRIGGSSGRNSYERASEVSLSVSNLGKESGLAIVCVCQLNRGPESRDEKRPNIADLRDSGQIEQDADGILFLFRPDYYGLSDPNYVPTYEAELIIAKWRDGARGKTIKLGTNMAQQRFENLSGEYQAIRDYENNF